VGMIYYGGTELPLRIADETLAHVKVVALTKLRRNESFTLSWQHSAEQPRGRSTIWMHPSISLRFTFDDPEPCELSSVRLVDLANAANSSGGITVVSDDVDLADRPTGDRKPGPEEASRVTSEMAGRA